MFMHQKHLQQGWNVVCLISQKLFLKFQFKTVKARMGTLVNHQLGQSFIYSQFKVIKGQSDCFFSPWLKVAIWRYSIFAAQEKTVSPVHSITHFQQLSLCFLLLSSRFLQQRYGGVCFLWFLQPVVIQKLNLPCFSLVPLTRQGGGWSFTYGYFY